MYLDKSDNGIEYTINPEAPRPTSANSRQQTSVIPVLAVSGSTVKYSVTDFKRVY